MLISICSGWEFTEKWSAEFRAFEGRAEEVRLPHSVRPLPQNYALPADYEMVCGYRRRLNVPAAWAGKRLFLQFDGAAHIACVYVNGVLAAGHRCGYTAFRVEITSLVRPGEENGVAVKLDCTENGEIPPFGFVIDYLTYGGLYREAWLDVREQSLVKDVFVTAGMDRRADVRFEIDGAYEKAAVRILDGEAVLAGAEGRGELSLSVPAARLWDPDCPQLYTCEVSLPNGDKKAVSFGFRSVEFRADELLLNGRPYFLRGLNRHQCFPYIGYAAPESLQREDARILREELQLTAVRTSHYPQSHYFLDECDRRGLLVFTEIPGWQHIGDEKWIDQAVENVREMVTQYRNHPSIVLWGVRINESQDNDEFYRRTNALAHELDPGRPTSGVRYLEKSSLLEDVYAYNDFSHKGNNPGCKPKDKVTPDMSKALLISEHDGHMFPTKSYDPWSKRQEQALRHARVLDAAAGEGDIAGTCGWCMADYNTHQDFGSGDRICYHGVLDMFRNPKPAAAVYAVEQDEIPVLEISSSMDIGEHPASNMGKIYILTNADSVRMYRNDVLLHEYTHADSPYRNLRRGPILITDFIGPRLEQEEKMLPKQAEIVKEILNYSAVNGWSKLPPKIVAKAGVAMAKYKMTYQDAYDLYGKYIGNWGASVPTFRFEAVKDGKVVKTVEKSPVRSVRLDAVPDHTDLREGAAYDAASIRITARDQNGNRLPFFNGTVVLAAEGPIAVVGTRLVQLRGGCGGTYVKTTGEAGQGTLILACDQTEPVQIKFNVTVSE